jgi:hypothetical protein
MTVQESYIEAVMLFRFLLSPYSLIGPAAMYRSSLFADQQRRVVVQLNV